MKKGHLEDIKEIRSIMERSSRFISLSGLSGVFAGIYALVGAYLGFKMLGLDIRVAITEPLLFKGNINEVADFRFNFLLIPIAVLVLALLTGYMLTRMKAKKQGVKIWSKASMRMTLNLAIPLVTGGILSLIMMHHGIYFLLASVTLIFYGLALLNASKYTLEEIRYLGISEVVLGLISSFFIEYGLLFWIIGFGVLHIIYGAFMWWKYEK